jgi:hypothetical protein
MRQIVGGLGTLGIVMEVECTAEECYLGSPENTLGRVDEDTLGFK